MVKMCLFACLLCVLMIVETETLTVVGHVGKNITAICRNQNFGGDVKSNDKYICKSPCKKDKHIIIKAKYKEAKKKDRIQLFNGPEGLYVTFINLKKSDAGKYYCGVDQTGPDSYIELNLKVIDGPTTAVDTVTVVSAVSLDVIRSSTIPTTELDIFTDLSDSYTTLCTTPTASASQGSGSGVYATIGVIAILTTLIILWRLMRRQLKAVSSAASPQDDAQEVSLFAFLLSLYILCFSFDYSSSTMS
ncbi:CMRF35-like molecule 1 [Stegastes partitus]|uniref:CMRF35-like molecule 1 n=1 Tax=Stegastes partitus TaxID=144197 RepID=A0A9Y4JS17_9TELE|nr:PREDICTED: CMRF35-like molecule 1 [Stegastes partitus]